MKKLFRNDKLIACALNKYLCNIFKNLSIPKDPCFEDQTSNSCTDRVKASIVKYKDHPIIIYTNPIQDGPLRGWIGSRMGCKKTPFPKIYHTYPAMIKLGTVTLYIKKI